MRVLISAVSIVCLAQPLLSHHGPWTRGYDTARTVVIEGVITKCVECGNRGKGHGILQVQVDSMPWSVTMPDTPALRKGKVDLGKLKKGTVVRVTGFARNSRPYDMFETEILSNGIRILWLEDQDRTASRHRSASQYATCSRQDVLSSGCSSPLPP
jgi:hypothetical protein